MLQDAPGCSLMVPVGGCGAGMGTFSRAPLAESESGPEGSNQTEVVKQ